MVVIAPAVTVVAHVGLRIEVVDVAALFEQVLDGDVFAEEAAVTEVALGSEEDVEEGAGGVRSVEVLGQGNIPKPVAQGAVFDFLEDGICAAGRDLLDVSFGLRFE